MPTPIRSPRRRRIKILRLFFGLVFSFFLQYARSRIAGRPYNFFQDAARNRRRAIQIRVTALEMGGVLIKLGQFLSSRVDLLPSEYIEELALLQDEVPGVPFADIRDVVEGELGGSLGDLFASFETEAIAAASLGQVHKAVLLTGQAVAVKVQRPHIREIVEADLRNLQYIVNWLDRHTPIGRRANLQEVLHEFEVTLRLELDYLQEAHHAERLAVVFSNTAEIAVPRIFWSHSTERVLTLQFMTGVKVTDFPALERDGISREDVAEILMRAYLVQILGVGFFHADPHPGNILVRPGPVVVLLDFGMVGQISPQMRENIRRVFLGVVRRDFDDVLTALGRLGFYTRDADVRALKRALVWVVDTFYGLSFGELQAIDPIFVLNQLQDVLFAESVQIPSNFAFLGRAVGTLSGLCTALDPSFQFVTVAEPFAKDLIRADRGLRGAAGQIAEEVRALVGSAYSLPFLARNVLQDVHGGELDFRRELAGIVQNVERVERGIRRMLYALVISGLLIAGALVFRTHYSVFAVGALAVAFILLIVILFPFRRKR